MRISGILMGLGLTAILGGVLESGSTRDALRGIALAIGGSGALIAGAILGCSRPPPPKAEDPSSASVRALLDEWARLKREMEESAPYGSPAEGGRTGRP